jgi:predicted nucleotidyltransferase
VQETAKLLELLARGDVEFVVVGGYAAVLHGSTYVTQDLDICIVCSPENIERLRRLLKDLDPRHRMTAQKFSFLETPPPGTELKNIYLRTRMGVLDISSEVMGVGGFERLKASAQQVTLGAKSIHVMSLRDLIVAKEALARDKDLLVAKELRAIALLRGETQPGT